MPNQAPAEPHAPMSHSPGAGASSAAARDVAEARQAETEAVVSVGVPPDTNSPLRYGLTRLLDERGEIRPLEAVEEEMIRFAVEHCHGQIGEVAKRLGMGRSTLYRKLRTYRI